MSVTPFDRSAVQRCGEFGGKTAKGEPCMGRVHDGGICYRHRDDGRVVNDGRPPTFATPEELDEKVQAYVAACREDELPPTVSGMALHLGFVSRQSFYDYGKRPTFSYTIKRARLLIEAYHEAALFRPGCGGSIFWLKNHGWSDQRHVEHAGSIVHRLEAMTSAELESLDEMDDESVLRLLSDGG